MVVGMTRKRTRRTQAQRSSETKAALLDATLDLLVESGYKATTTTAVAERAGVSLGALLHHFPTKTDLLTAAIGHAFDRRTAEYRRAMVAVDDAEDKLDATLDLLWSMWTGPTFTAFVELWVAARTDAELAGPLVAVDREFLQTSQEIYAEYFLGDQARDDDDARSSLHLVFSLVTGLAFSDMIDGYHPFASKPVIETFKAMVRASVAARRSSVSENTEEVTQ
jgi:AcrR family transcriptional regulator